MREQDGDGAQAMALQKLGQRAHAGLPGVDDEAVLALGGCDRVTIGAPGARGEPRYEHDGLRAGMWGPPD